MSNISTEDLGVDSNDDGGLVRNKVVAMVLTGAVPLLLGLIPWKVGRWVHADNIRHQILVSSFLCYGGGILFGLSLLHLLPEVRESFENASAATGSSGTTNDGDEEGGGGPLAETLLCIGFFLIYGVEELVHAACDSDLQHDHCVTVDQCNDVTRSMSVHRAFSTQRGNCDAGEPGGTNNPLTTGGGGGGGMVCGTNTNASQLSEPLLGRSTSSAIRYRTFNEEEEDVENEERDATESERHRASVSEISSLLQPSTALAGNQGIPQEVSTVIVTTNHNSAIRDLLTCLALSLHAVFEGLAVGLAADNVSMWALCAGVAMHKYILAFCIGLELFTTDKAKSFKLNLVYLIIFAMMSPLGIGLGIAVTTSMAHGSPAYDWTVGILQALAAGTLLYVVVFEVLQREKSKEQVPGLVQLFFVVAGFITIYLFVTYGPEV